MLELAAAVPFVAAASSNDPDGTSGTSRVIQPERIPRAIPPGIGVFEIFSVTGSPSSGK